MNFRYLEHPTDVFMQVWGKTQGELFVQAAHGMMNKLGCLRRPGNPAHFQTQTIDLQAPAVEDLFVAWLGEILYRFTVHDFYFADASFTALTATNLSATIEGWPVAQVNLEKGLEVKGIAYHGLKIRSEPRWEAEVILDV